MVERRPRREFRCYEQSWQLLLSRPKAWKRIPSAVEWYTKAAEEFNAMYNLAVSFSVRA